MSASDAGNAGRVVRSGIDYLVSPTLETVLANPRSRVADTGRRSGIEVLDGRKVRKPVPVAKENAPATQRPAQRPAAMYVAPQVESGYEVSAPAPSQANAGYFPEVPTYQPAVPVRPFYYDFGEWLMWRSPRTFRLLQGGRRRLVRVPMPFGRKDRKADSVPTGQRRTLVFRLGQLAEWSLRAAWRNKLGAALVLVVVAALIALPFAGPGPWSWRLVPWLLCGLLLGGAMAAAILREAFSRLISAQDRAIAHASRAAREDTRQLARRVGGLENRLVETRRALAEVRNKLGTP